jgi:hypothetical protein
LNCGLGGSIWGVGAGTSVSAGRSRFGSRIGAILLSSARSRSA